MPIKQSLQDIVKCLGAGSEVIINGLNLGSKEGRAIFGAAISRMNPSSISLIPSNSYGLIDLTRSPEEGEGITNYVGAAQLAASDDEIFMEFITKPHFQGFVAQAADIRYDHINGIYVIRGRVRHLHLYKD